MTSTRLSSEQDAERNSRIVDEHFHNENPADIDRAIALYSLTFVRRRAADNWAFDDSIVDLTLVGDVENNVPHCPLPAGTRVSLRLLHYFELDDEGRITRESGYELWRPMPRGSGGRQDRLPGLLVGPATERF